MRDIILQKLAELEKERNIKVLYAVESGSRAWGFSSSNSDYDVRFIYQQPLPQYLRLVNQPDSIEIIDKTQNLDLVGWDLKKTLGLLAKSNPSLLEWLYSDFVYTLAPTPLAELKSLAKAFYSVPRALYHYLHMAEGNYKSYIKGQNIVQQKKYLYVLRPLLACNWLIQKGSTPPTEVEKTLELVEGQFIHPHIRNIIDLKRSGSELGLILPIADINSYIDFQISYIKHHLSTLPKEPEPDISLLETYFVKQVTSGGNQI